MLEKIKDINKSRFMCIVEPSCYKILCNYTLFTNAKILNNAETEKHFWMINAVRPINKGISRKIEESPQGATKQIEADCGTN